MGIRLGAKRGGRGGNSAEEIESLVRETQGGSAAPVPSSSSSSSSSVIVWKVISLLLFGIVILFLSDSLEFKVVKRGAGNADMDAIPGHVVQKSELLADAAAATATAATAAATAATATTEPPTAQEAANSAVPDPAAPDPSPTDPPVQPEVKAETPEATPTTTTTTTPPPTDPAVSEESERYSYTRRGQPMQDADRLAMTEKWGSWTLQDDKERPTQDALYVSYPNRDIPRANFPTNAWQIDNQYLSKFLPEALRLVERAQDAILAEYGHTEGTWEERTKMFQMEFHDATPLGDVTFPKQYFGNQGGWTTTRSWEGVKRRLLHSVMTEDSFIFAMGGHSAAAGHGNHFVQSYTLQVQWILEAVFSRLGVRHQSRNFGNGGLGTMHNGIAAGSIYGPDVDFLMWDSGMTENEKPAQDVFARQALLGGTKVPAIWHMYPAVSAPLHDHADVDVGAVGTGFADIFEMTKIEELATIPWAAQYVRCSGELHGVCRENEYMGVCWIDRDDITPPTKQGTPTGRAGWHPGNRKHQVTGRVLAFTLLTALKEILTTWQDAEGYVLPDEAWHVTSYYQNQRDKIAAMEPGACQTYAEKDLEFLCKYPMKARTEFTPRSFPSLTNIRTLMPPDQVATIGSAEANIYQPPDVFNPNLHPPPGEIDVLNILENGIDFRSVLNPDYTKAFYRNPSFATPSMLPLGKGMNLATKAGDEFCDGSVDSFCDRGSGNKCMLPGHNDGRNGIIFDSLSGWVTMNIPDLKNGYIVIKMECWHAANSVKATTGWTSINNNEAARQLMLRRKNSTMATIQSDHRSLKQSAPEYCDDFTFEYAIDGVITSLSKDEFDERKMNVQRVVETVTLLKDPEYTGGVEKEVEVAIRMTGCARLKVFQLTHIYWS